MARRSSSSSCAICDNSNLASICASCVNYSLNDYNASLRSLKSVRDNLYARLDGALSAKKKADDQVNQRFLQNQRLTKLKERLHLLQRQLTQDKAKIKKAKSDLNDKQESLESAFAKLNNNRAELLDKFYRNLIYTQSLGLMAITSERLHKQSVVIKQICKLFPMRRVTLDGEKKNGSGGSYDQICNVRLPRGLDPHSVPPNELASSLGYMIQLLNLIVPNLAAPALHNSGFAGSCSRIWQRDSYYDARPSSESKEYPLFMPRAGEEYSWSGRSSDFGVASVDSERKSYLEDGGSSSFTYSSGSSLAVQTHKDLQKGISLLKKSVACITAYCYNSLLLDAPSEGSTFEAFAKLLATLSSSKEVRSVFSLKMACARSGKKNQSSNRTVWNADSGNSFSCSMDGAHTTMLPSMPSRNLLNSTASYLYPSEAIESAKLDSLAEGWDIVEHPTLPPPPSQIEDVEHWTRAMFVDATRK